MTADENAEVILQTVKARPPSDARQLIAIAGPPAAGKSTVAALLVDKMNAAGLPTGLLPMDGFHLDNADLIARDLLSRKGAPETFDFDGFHATLRRLQTEGAVSVPRFDRAQDRTLPHAAKIRADQCFVVVEGNYLILDKAPWRDLAPLWSLTVFVSVGLAELATRLMQRWLDHGLTPQEAETKMQANDLPNASLVMLNRLPADLMLEDAPNRS
ncbi:MAG: uridine kinase [Pseudomonadota bacterium]